jgi:hypothetical protein
MPMLSRFRKSLPQLFDFSFCFIALVSAALSSHFAFLCHRLRVGFVLIFSGTWLLYDESLVSNKGSASGR